MQLFKVIQTILRDRFNLDEDKEDERLIIASIRKEVHFRGTNLWTLIFAILVASIGLNMNATAVIIGAMLISPVMGPIMGVGLGIAINDFELLKTGIKNLLIATLISIITSAVYFLLTPIHDTNSELLARTNPSLWDVLIAFFGGLAGIVAGTRKERSNVIPGVAIATALMPPLCTAGFWLSLGRWYQLLDALYLYFINSVFICLATFLIVKHLRFHKKEFASPEREKSVARYIWMTVFITIVPSIFLAYRIVQKSLFEQNAERFVVKEFRFHHTQVVNKSFHWTAPKKSIELLLVGQPLSSALIDSLKQRMPLYGLDSTTKLNVHQGLDAKQEIDIAQIKASILEDVYKGTADTADVKNAADKKIPDISRELKIIFPQVLRYSLTQTIFYHQDSSRTDTIMLLTTTCTRKLPVQEQRKLTAWVKQRIGADTLKLINEPERK